MLERISTWLVRLFPWVMSVAIVGSLASVVVSIANLMITDTRAEQTRAVAARPRLVARLALVASTPYCRVYRGVIAGSANYTTVVEGVNGVNCGVSGS